MVNDVFRIDFPENITPVHFIKLRLLDDKGKLVGDNFYWRSTNKYEGKQTLTGPTTAGFQDINKLANTSIQAKCKTRKENGKHFIDLELKNTGKTLSFFTQVQWLDKSGKPVRPSFYTDNFMSLIPKEGKNITIETDIKNLPDTEYVLVVKGFNVPEQRFKLKM